MARQGNNPKRRVAGADFLSDEAKRALTKKIRYVGSGHHKRYPADYGFERVNPRPIKSMCDLVRHISLNEATSLLESGVRRCMVSEFGYDGVPKFIWSVDEFGEVYESKTDPNTLGDYHGYRLEEEDDMRGYVRQFWDSRTK